MRKIEEKVETIESALLEMIKTHTQFQLEMKEFKEEMKEANERHDKELKEFKDEMLFLNNKRDKEMKEFKEEMRLSRERRDKEMKLSTEKYDKEMKLSTEKHDKEMKDFRRYLGEISNAQGRIVEDFIFPNLKGVIKKYFNLENPIVFYSRTIKRKSSDKGMEKEFDGIVVFDDYVFMNETKSKPKIDYVKEYVDFISSEDFFDYFPEYKNKKFIPIFSSLYIPDNIVKVLTKNNIFAFAMGDDNMDLLNPELVKHIK